MEVGEGVGDGVATCACFGASAEVTVGFGMDVGVCSGRTAGVVNVFCEIVLGVDFGETLESSPEENTLKMIATISTHSNTKTNPICLED